MSINTKSGASLEAIQHHYDLSNQFYELWLDDYMNYSGALYLSDGESLEQAQINKLDYHIQQAQAGGAEHVLDIGCGWGAIATRLLKNHGTKKVTGLTLSDAQAQFVRNKNLVNADIRVENWQDHKPEKPYDSIISIGAFEHFAQIEYTEAEKTQAYRRFFETCQQDFLKSGGYMSLQTFAYGSVRRREDMTNTEATKFLAAEIFRETDPPHLSNIIEASQGLFEVVSLRNDRLDYAETLREWMVRLKNQRQAATDLVGAEEVERFAQYLQYSFAGFKTGNLDLYRITFRRIDPPWRKPI